VHDPENEEERKATHMRSHGPIHAHYPERRDALSRLLERLEQWPETTTATTRHDEDQSDGEDASTDAEWMRLPRPVQQEDATLEDPVAATPALIVESTLEPVDDSIEPTVDPLGDGMVWSGGSHHHGTPLLLLGLGALLTALGLVVVLVLLPAWTMATATVTILPTETSLHMTTMVQVVAGTVGLTTAQMPGRDLPTIMLSEAHTVATTGIGTHRAQAAQGSLTFYNAAPYPQTVLAGTRLMGGDGVQVVTDQEAVIPAAAFPTEGATSVSAHTLLVGPAGNIAAHDLYGACCHENVFVVNPTAFSGGQLARSFPMVTARDLGSTVAMLRPAVQESMQAALATQLAPGETLLTPVACTALVNSDHAVGVQATQVSVQLTQTCRGVVYRTQALQRLMMQQMSQQARTQLGTRYHLVEGSVHLSLTHMPSSQGSHDIVGLLQVQGQSTWVAAISHAQLATLASLIAGKTVAEATTLMLRDLGIHTVSWHLTGRDPTRLPSDPHAIHLVIVTLP